uniref:Lon proteolytic domain-containing protein n=1 Tax=Meloidogyne javanica TaxID=6303 RepID=A0A915LUH1_MELJA
MYRTKVIPCGLSNKKVDVARQGGFVGYAECEIIELEGLLSATGNLKLLMNEAVIVARNCVTTFIKEQKLGNAEKLHMLVHIIPGSSAKDGGSGGAGLAVCMLSRYLEIPPLNGTFLKLFMTENSVILAEIDLKGRLYAVGGLESKLAAAKRVKLKTPKARINDIPNVAQPDEMFDGGVCKSKSELHKEIDPYIDSETGMLPKCTDQLSDSSISSSQVSSASTIRAASPSKRKPKATTATNRQPKKAKQKRQPTMLVSSAATVAILPAPSPPVGEREELFEGVEQQKHHH